MCTAISVTAGDNYFGRNLDFEKDFGEKITITPRGYCLYFRNGLILKKHYAIIGMALPYNNYPLYFDATNEKGLSMAGLRFLGNAHYNEKKKDAENVASFELILRILGTCDSVFQAEKLLEKINITNEAFDEKMPPSPLHWLISDKEKSIVLEQTKKGLKVYDNPLGVLTNNPTFDIQLFNLNNFLSLSRNEPCNSFSDKLDLSTYSRGMGAIGLPGDLSSMSRFVRASFTKENSVFGFHEEEIVSQFFHILYSVYQTRGCVMVEGGFEITIYSSCCNTKKGIYYYTTYENSGISKVEMFKENLNSDSIITYDLVRKPKIICQN